METLYLHSKGSKTNGTETGNLATPISGQLVHQGPFRVSIESPHQMPSHPCLDLGFMPGVSNTEVLLHFLLDLAIGKSYIYKTQWDFAQNLQEICCQCKAYHCITSTP